MSVHRTFQSEGSSRVLTNRKTLVGRNPQSEPATVISLCYSVPSTLHTYKVEPLL